MLLCCCCCFFKEESKESIDQQLPDVLEHQVVLVVPVDQGHPVWMDQRKNTYQSHNKENKTSNTFEFEFNILPGIQGLLKEK